MSKTNNKRKTPEGASPISHSRSIRVIILGMGNVGSCLTQQLLDYSQHHVKEFGIKFNIVCITDSKQLVGQPGRVIPEAVLRACIESKKNGNGLAKSGAFAAKTLPAPKELVANFCSGVDTIIVDCSATPEYADVCLQILKSGARIVMANKKPFTSSQHLWNECFSSKYRGHIGMESTVGAGTPFVACVQRLVRCNDMPTTMMGAFSGSLAFICASLEQGITYSDAVRKAFDLGYLEPDPRDDLGGQDVRRKALILSRLIGAQLELSDIEVTGLAYPEYENVDKTNVKEFLSSLSQYDAEYKKKAETAKKDGKVLRYVASIKRVNNKINCAVGLQSVDNNSALGMLKGSDNMLEIYTTIYKESPLVIKGSGAGAETTSAGCMADMVDLAQNMMIY